MHVTVSIPFKRESGFKEMAIDANAAGDKLLEFQFPSNGKVDSKVYPLQEPKTACFRFNSLQTGKWIQSHNSIVFRSRVSLFQFPSNGKVDSKHGPQSRHRNRNLEFQFPSNGKVDSKYAAINPTEQEVRDVSIPFKRESGFKA